MNESFTVDVDLTGAVFGGSTYSDWGGYDVELDYDPNVLGVQFAYAPTTLCADPPPVFRAEAAAVGAGCAFQSSTVTQGQLLGITFTCLRSGTSALHLPLPYHAQSQIGGNGLFTSGEPVDFSTTLNDGAVNCDGALPTATNIPTFTPSATSTPNTNSPTATATAAGPRDTATFEIQVPLADQPLNLRFLVRTDLATFVPGSMPYWAGYDVEVAYDPTVLAIDDVARGLCLKTLWGNPPEAHIVTGCFARRETSTGVLENIVVRCLRDASTVLHFVP